jgi:hypothetical protein
MISCDQMSFNGLLNYSYHQAGATHTGVFLGTTGWLQNVFDLLLILAILATKSHSGA